MIRLRNLSEGLLGEFEVMIRDILKKLKKETEQLNFGREIIRDWLAERGNHRTSLNILDLGLGNGRDLVNARETLDTPDVSLWGVDVAGEVTKRAEDLGIQAVCADIEVSVLPFEDQFFDIVIANQIIEHTKEIFWIFSELSRVVKAGGFVIVGVPNLASFHNRVALLFGEQPTCIELFGPHVRGITKPSFIRFVERGGFFDVVEVKGSNFYPFPPVVSSPLSRLLPSLSVALFFLIRRTTRQGNFSSVLDGVILETRYRVVESSEA